RALKTFHNTTAPNVIVVYLFIVLQIKVHEVCSLHREGSHEYARPSVCPTQDKPIFIELISKNSVDIEEQSQRRPVRRKGSDQHAGRVGIHHLPRLSIAIFICIRSMVQHWVCKWFLWHLWECRIVAEVSHTPGVTKRINEWIGLWIRLPVLVLLWVFHHPHNPWITVVSSFAQPEHVFRVIVIARVRNSK